MGAAVSIAKRPIRFEDSDCRQWIRIHAPCRWMGNIQLHFQEVPLSSLEDAGSPKDPAVVIKWLDRMRAGRSVPPLIVSKSSDRSYYVHDGNHRLCALRTLAAEQDDFPGSGRVCSAPPRILL